jgi:hypothetical protein
MGVVPRDPLVPTAEQERIAKTLINQRTGLEFKQIKNMLDELRADEGFDWAGYIELTVASMPDLRDRLPAVDFSVSRDLVKRSEKASSSSAALTAEGVPLGEEARGTSEEVGAPISLTEATLHGVALAEDVELEKERADAIREAADKRAIEGEGFGEGDDGEGEGEGEPAVGEKAPRGGSDYPTYENTRKSDRVSEAFVTEDGKHFLKVGVNGDYIKSEKVRVGSDKHRGLWGVRQEAQREGKDDSGLAWIPPYIPGPDGKTLPPSKPRSAAAKSVQSTLAFPVTKKGGAGSSGSK